MRPVPFNPEYQLALYELQQDRVIGASGQRRLAGLAQRTLFHDDVRLLQEFFRSADRIVQYNRYYANREPLKVTLPISIPAATSPAERLIQYHLAALEADEKYLSSPR